ncbi:Uncharacterised protein [Burkholderia pseudomallei]|nr:Uncharacterised protein [Burkholderia pseudomallei]CAJ6782536.1 Uncharacterised protein [Burkholderia pseudomallei]CAJ6937598.1 Uncharacterised protein [Burkholderia pseudomallei]CAK0295904.1 Uncharacterised protein [Burkholderia pseudomallei]
MSPPDGRLIARGSWFAACGSRLEARGSRLTVRDSQFATRSSRGRAIRLYLGGTQGQAHRRRREKEPPRDRSAQSPKLERTAAMAASRMATCDRGIAASTMSPLARSRAFRDCARTDASARARMQPALRERHLAGRSGSQCDVSAMSSARSPADRPSTRRRALLPGIDRVEPELRMASCGGEWSTESAIESSSGSSIEFSIDCRICRGARTYGRDITRRRQERAAWADAYRASFGARRGEHGCAICHARRTVRDARGAGYMAPCHVARFPRAAGRVERVERPASEAADGSPSPPLPFGTCNGATACGAGPGPCASPEGGRVSRGRPPPQRGDEPTAARRVEGDGG